MNIKLCLSSIARRLFNPSRSQDAIQLPLDETLNYKWLPLIKKDYCTGCNECVLACKPKCLELVWSFATLQNQDICDSDGKCVTACEHNVITMTWQPIKDNHAMSIDNGIWQLATISNEREQE